MRILITNDDGIHGKGLMELTKWACRLGEVTVVAPAVEQSAKSHSIEIHKPFAARKVDFFPGVSAWTVDSSPADCVRFAIIGLDQKFDLVFSGINKGLNIGRDIIYSGTVSAICEAACLGVPGIAFSTDPASFDSAVLHLDPIWKMITDNNMLSLNNLYNINIPLCVKGIRITRQGGPYFSDQFQPLGDDLYRPVGSSIYVDHHDYSIDTDATLHDYISITPLTLERTDMPTFQQLSSLNP